MRKVVVTGGAGFIGSYLVRELLKDTSTSICVIDDFSVGSPDKLPKSSGLKVVKMSVLNSAMDDKEIYGGVDVVYHLAALTRPRWSIVYPEKTNHLNVGGTLKVLNLCVKYKVGKIVFVSSASAYGKQNKLLLKENMKLHPMSPYALTKQIGEQYCQLFGELYSLRYDIVRPFNVYGPGQTLQGAYSAAVSNFIDMLNKGKTPYITGDGKQVRDFVYVEDVARLMVLLGERAGSGEIFNAGSGKSASINQIYKLISEIMNKNVKPDYKEPVVDPQTQADISKAKKLLGWGPNYTLKQGLKKTCYS